MRTCLFVLLTLTLLWLGQADVQPAAAHGGNYRPPAGEIPPGQREPRDPQPPPQSPGTPPGGGGPESPPGDGPPSDGGGAPPTPGSPKVPAPPDGAKPPMGGGAITGKGNAKAPPRPSMSHWLFWWANNRDRILNLKAAVKRRSDRVSTKNSAHFFGTGSEQNRSAIVEPTQKLIRERIVPALLTAIGNREIHPDIRGGALIALARCPDADVHLRLFTDCVRDENRLVQESALLALGILQKKCEPIRATLLEFIESSSNPARSRCFAIIALGLLRDNAMPVIECMRRRLDGREAVADVPMFALMTLGLIGDESVVEEMLGWLRDGRVRTHHLTELERAHLVAALGKIGDPRALTAIYAQLRKKGRLSRRSAWIAMGQLLPHATGKQRTDLVSRMIRLLPEESDDTARNFGLVALGRIAGDGGASDTVRRASVRFLLERFDGGSTVSERPMAALALGLVGLDNGDGTAKPESLRYELAEPIRRKLAGLRGDRSSLGALALALGMLGDRRAETQDLLSGILTNRGLDRRLRGAAAVALGLIGETSAKAVVLKTLGERADRSLRTDVAVAAGLLGDAEAEELLVGILNDTRVSQFELGSVALALGQIGSRDSISPLLGILQADKVNATYPDLTRALVTVALGKIADQRNLRVLSRVSEDVNYRATVPSLEELLTIL